MNIFVLDKNPTVAAAYHCDKHISKMIIESAQMLSTILGGSYKPTHKNHPCTLWAGESQANAAWLIALAYALNSEWQNRYKHERNHKSIAVIDELVDTYALANLPNIGMTPFALAMPDQFKQDDPVRAYRAYYHSKAFATWKYSPVPPWWNNEI